MIFNIYWRIQMYIYIYRERFYDVIDCQMYTHMLRLIVMCIYIYMLLCCDLLGYDIYIYIYTYIYIYVCIWMNIYIYIKCQVLDLLLCLSLYIYIYAQQMVKQHIYIGARGYIVKKKHHPYNPLCSYTQVATRIRRHHPTRVTV